MVEMKGKIHQKGIARQGIWGIMNDRKYSAHRAFAYLWRGRTGCSV
jgi:hypothetical protein